MDGNGADAEGAVWPDPDVLCGTLFLLPRAKALSASLGEGARKGKASSYAFGWSAGFRFTRLIVPEKVNSGRPAEVSLPRRKISEPPARDTSPTHSTSSPSRAASRKSQAIVGEGHEAAAMDVPGAVEVLFLDPERRADAAVVLDFVPERADMALKTVANPGSPALEFPSVPMWRSG